jgi:methionyl-tRNA formyltransferase
MAVPVVVLFFGSGPVALPVLERLLRCELVEIDSVVTTPPRPAGRGRTLRPTPVAELAERRGLRLRIFPRLRDPAVLAELAATGAGLIVLADYGRMIPPAILDLPAHGALNVHPSLLPRHRGASPVAGAILAGDQTTGVTLMRMDEGLDTGPILAQAAVPLEGTEVTPELEARLAQLGAELLVEHLPAWLEGRLEARPQPQDGVSVTRLLRREDGRLDPALGASVLERQVRAYQPWPGSFLELDGVRLKVWAASVLEQDQPAEAGAVVPCGDTLGLATVEGLLRLDQVQPAGKRRMSGAEFRRGRRS